MSFQKFIGIPVARHSDLLKYEKECKSLGSVKQATDAIVKNQETQEHLQRKQDYKEQQEDIPKTLNTEIPQKAITTMPPPSRKRQQPIQKASQFAFPVFKKFRDGEKRKLREKKVAKKTVASKTTGLSKWQFIKDE